jgi:hypothetical protein
MACEVALCVVDVRAGAVLRSAVAPWRIVLPWEDPAPRLPVVCPALACVAAGLACVTIVLACVTTVAPLTIRSTFDLIRSPRCLIRVTDCVTSSICIFTWKNGVFFTPSPLSEASSEAA